jgi:tryptophan synthase alpha subunit
MEIIILLFVGASVSALVGSALVEVIHQAEDKIKAAGAFVKSLAQGHK